MAAVRSLLPVALVALVAAAGCGGSSGATPDGGLSTSQTMTWLASSRPKLDLLFMIDNSASMATAQANLVTNLASFTDVLKNLAGGLPDLHIAVVTSDMGAGDGSSIQGCTTSGDNGVFRFQPTGSCTATGLDVNATFIADSGGASPVTNFGSQDITTVLKCIIPVGTTGCGFQHQLGAVARALGADGAPPPPQNAGFLRPDAQLAIILLTAQDDCTGPPGSALFDPTSSLLNSMYGPTERFLCNEWGHLCVPPAPRSGAPAQPSRFAPNNLPTDTVTYTPPMAQASNCESFEQSPVLTSVGSIADGIKALKADPANQILAMGFVGLNEGPSSNGYTVSWRTAPTLDSGPWPQIVHACGSEGSATSYADPAVRIEQFVKQFGTNGLVDTFCQAHYSPSLATVATKISQMNGAPCFAGALATKPSSRTPDCAVSESVPDPNNPGHPVTTNVPFCDTSATAPCWTLIAPPASVQCAGDLLAINEGAAMLPADATITATCSLCVANHPDPSRGCP